MSDDLSDPSNQWEITWEGARLVLSTPRKDAWIGAHHGRFPPNTVMYRLDGRALYTITGPVHYLVSNPDDDKGAP